MSDAEVIENILSGETQYFEGLVERYLPLVRAVCASRVFNSDAVDDLVQESFLISFTRLDRLKNPAKFGPWIASIARNTCKGHVRSAVRSEARLERIKQDAESSAEDMDPAAQAAQHELYAWVRDQIAQLPPKTREAMVLSYVEGYSAADIAGMTGLREGAVKKRLQYGRKLIGENIWREDGVEHVRDRNAATIRKRVMTALPLASAPWLGKSAVGASTLAAGAGLWLKGGAAALVLTAVAGLTLVMNSTDEEIGDTGGTDEFQTQLLPEQSGNETNTTETAVASNPISTPEPELSEAVVPEPTFDEEKIAPEESEFTLLTLASGRIVNGAGLPLEGVIVTPMYLRIPAKIERQDNSRFTVHFEPQYSKYRSYFYENGVLDEKNNPIQPIVTGDDGTYNFKHILPKEMVDLFSFDISFQLTAPGYHDYITRFISTGSEFADIKFIPGGSIHGKVRDFVNKDPVQNATVALTSIHQSPDLLIHYNNEGAIKSYTTLNSEVLYLNKQIQGFIPPSISLPELTATTSASGEWKIENAPFGLYVVKLRESDYITANREQRFELTTDISTKIININAEVGGVLKGSLIVGGEPAPNQKAYIYLDDKKEFISDDAGKYRVSGLPNFKGSMSARRETGNGGSQSSLKEIVEITPGLTSEVNFDFAGGTAAVEGYVLMGADRTPVASRMSLTYQIVDSAGLPNRESISTTTDSEGYYIFENLPPGEVFISCSPEESFTGGAQRRDAFLIEGETAYREILIYSSSVKFTVNNIPDTNVNLFGTIYKGWHESWDDLSLGGKLARLGKAEQMWQQTTFISSSGRGQGSGEFSGGLAPGKYSVVAASWPCQSSLDCIREMGLEAFFRDFKIAMEHITIVNDGDTVSTTLDFDK